MSMITCPYCRHLHPKGYICPDKPKQKYYNTGSREQRFRSSGAWQSARSLAIIRDNYLCRVCLSEGTYTIDKKDNPLEVHHIVKLRDNYELRCDTDNLITLCEKHHKQADRGEISADTLRSLIGEYPPMGEADSVTSD